MSQPQRARRNEEEKPPADEAVCHLLSIEEMSVNLKVHCSLLSSKVVLMIAFGVFLLGRTVFPKVQFHTGLVQGARARRNAPAEAEAEG